MTHELTQRAIEAWNAKGDASVEDRMEAVIACVRAADGETWRCFHCGDTFTTQEDAKDHFGLEQLECVPACIIKAQDGGFIKQIRFLEDRNRELREQVARYVCDDSDCDRRMAGLVADHYTALIREEEKGYARGLADGRALSATPSPATGERYTTDQQRLRARIKALESAQVKLPDWDDVHFDVRAKIILDAFAGVLRKEDSPGAYEWYAAIRSNIALEAAQGARVQEPTAEMIAAVKRLARIDSHGEFIPMRSVPDVCRAVLAAAALGQEKG